MNPGNSERGCRDNTRGAAMNSTQGRGGSLPSTQEESPDRRSSVVTRPLASLTSGQALDRQRLGQWLSVGCLGDAGAQTEGGAAPRMRALKAKLELSVRLEVPALDSPGY